MEHKDMPKPEDMPKPGVWQTPREMLAALACMSAVAFFLFVVVVCLFLLMAIGHRHLAN
jgi:hypothetical protein